MSLVVCVRYVLNNIFVQITILRCAYMLIFFIMHVSMGMVHALEFAYICAHA